VPLEDDAVLRFLTLIAGGRRQELDKELSGLVAEISLD